jgi:lambda family phage portal protein
VQRRLNDIGRMSMPEVFGNLRNDYNMARTSRFRRSRPGVSSSTHHADYHYRSESDYYKTLELARDMDRNDVLVGTTIQRAVDNTLQGGFTPDPQTGDKGLDGELLARWWEWSEDPDQCDIQGENTFYALEEKALRSPYVDGDILGLGTVDGPLELVEGHRIKTPSNTKQNVVHGVLLDNRRRRLEYWVTKEDVSPQETVTKVGDVVRYPVRDSDGERNLFHVYTSKRISQTRGISALAPIIDALGMFEDINFARLVQAQVVSCFAIFRKRELDFRGGDNAPSGERTTDTMSDGTSRTIEGIGPGMQITGQPGEDILGFSPNVPNPEFFPHMKLILQLVGINLGLPLVLVLMDASETNFSGWRGAFDQAKLGFRANQRRLCDRFHRPIWRWKVRQWMAKDSHIASVARRNGANPFGCLWNFPTWPYIQPMDDAQADLLRLRNGLTSPRRLHAERGATFEEITNEILADNKASIAKAKLAAAEINSRFPDDGQRVHWRELLFLPTPDGISVGIQPAAAKTPGSQGEGNGDATS